jgi:AcrR family transcriptional regulator
MARTSKGDWIESGLALLRSEGESALTIDRSCTALGRTKGSFYHHFESADVFAKAVLEAWEQRHTEAPIAASRDGTDSARRRTLDTSVKALDWSLDLAVRGWALRDPYAREVVARVDARRIAYLESLLPRTLARARRTAIATLEYAAFLGAMQLDPMRTQNKPLRDAEKLLYEVLAQWLPA